MQRAVVLLDEQLVDVPARVLAPERDRNDEGNRHADDVRVLHHIQHQ
ncbi:hypothetical protein SDC9_142144 [bioreactor metagenome]|uniref:Uncharacterized protein n=1 Tax=bioreactor metagenome TaxID=1076179 RepID=A0A645E0B6_9ZZZZ